MKNLIHYIIVRRDLPLGVMAAMIAHAAADSIGAYDTDKYLFSDLGLGTKIFFHGATVVVLEAKNEAAIKDAVKYLEIEQLPYVVVTEPDPPYNGAFMAIGVVPDDGDELRSYFSSFQCLKTLDNPSEDA